MWGLPLRNPRMLHRLSAIEEEIGGQSCHFALTAWISSEVDQISPSSHAHVADLADLLHLDFTKWLVPFDHASCVYVDVAGKFPRQCGRGLLFRSSRPCLSGRSHWERRWCGCQLVLLTRRGALLFHWRAMGPANVTLTSAGGPHRVQFPRFSRLYILKSWPLMTKMKNMKVTPFFVLYAMLLTKSPSEVVCEISSSGGPLFL